MSKKFNKATAQAVLKLQNEGNWLMITAARKQLKDPSLPDHFSQSADYYLGIAKGNYTSISTLLSCHGKYMGFTANRIKVTLPFGVVIADPRFELEDYTLPDEVWAVARENEETAA